MSVVSLRFLTFSFLFLSLSLYSVIIPYTIPNSLRLSSVLTLDGELTVTVLDA